MRPIQKTKFKCGRCEHMTDNKGRRGHEDLYST